ncbi:MAG: B12-binding domain-containing radical SAM protein [Planctomycetes bacterium]|nr:B12-binding domain-containing radical SAM protein [Planctomycetota bacterium]
MNVLLISMPDCAPFFDAKWIKPPNLAMASIAGNIDAHHNVYIADLVLKRGNIKDIIPKLIHTYNPDVVGMGAMSFQFETAKRIATLIKTTNKHVKIILGGYHATLMYQKLSSDSDSGPFDFFFRGEGDIGFNEFLSAIEGSRGFDSIMGLSYHKKNSFIHNPPRSLENLRKIKIPDRSKRIWQGYHWYGSTIEIIETSRGCTMSCNYCSMSKMYGKNFRVYETKRVINDIENAKKHGAKCIIFADDNITLDIPRFEQLCEAIVEYKHNDVWYIIQASSIGIATSETLVEKMAKAGFKVVFLGIENVSEKNLKRMKKGGILEKTSTAIKRLHDYDIMILGGIIVGHPDDKESDIAQNYKYCRENNIDFVADQILTPYPKTESREDMLRMGLVTNENDFTKYNGYWANIKTYNLSSEDLQFIRWKYNREYSKIVVGTTPAFKKNFPIGYQYMTNLQTSYKNIKNLIFFNKNKTDEKELYRQEMEKAEAMNRFF